MRLGGCSALARAGRAARNLNPAERSRLARGVTAGACVRRFVRMLIAKETADWNNKRQEERGRPDFPRIS